MKQLLQHEADCTPLVPCNVCQVVSWLRTKLEAADFNHLVEQLEALEAPKPKRPYRQRNRSRTATVIEPEA